MIEREGQISEVFKRYLYGDLGPAERDALEDRLFAEIDFAEQLEDFENDLVDGFVRGEFTSHQKSEFETRYLISESHRQKTASAKLLYERLIAEPRPMVIAGAEHGFWTAVVYAFRNRRVALTSGLAAALLIGVIGTWVYFQVADAPIAKIEDNSNAIVDTGENSVDQSDNNNLEAQTVPANENGGGRSPSPSPTASPASANESEKQREQKSVFAFTLVPITRSESRPVLNVPRTAETVRLTLIHDDQRAFLKYVVDVRQSSGAAVWKKELPASRRPVSSAVVVNIPAAVLRAGNFEIALTGVTQDAQTEDLKFYQFSVGR